MKAATLLALGFALAAPVGAAELHGTVVCSGMRDGAGAVVYVAGIAGKTFPAPREHAQVDQRNLTFVPHVLAVLAGTTVEFLNSDTVLHNVFSPDPTADNMNLGT